MSNEFIALMCGLTAGIILGIIMSALVVAQASQERNDDDPKK